MLHRTTIVLPSRLKDQAVARAREQQISFGEFVRRAVENELTVRTNGKAKKSNDPYLDNLVVFEDDGPPDLSVRVDDFLYGDPR